MLSQLFKSIASQKSGEAGKLASRSELSASILNLEKANSTMPSKSPSRNRTLRFVEEMKEEEPSSLMRVEPEKDSGDLVLLVQAHRLLLKEAS